MPKFTNEKGLQYQDMFVYPNNSVYRGQMKLKDDETRQILAMAREASRDDSSQDKKINTRQFETDDEFSMIRHGYGIQYWTDGAHYEGLWVYNKAEGLGTFWHAEGDVYKGEFKRDMANGFGEYTHINGSKYKGDFKDDV